MRIRCQSLLHKGPGLLSNRDGAIGPQLRVQDTVYQNPHGLVWRQLPPIDALSESVEVSQGRRSAGLLPALHVIELLGKASAIRGGHGPGRRVHPGHGRRDGFLIANFHNKPR